ncbi:MAG: hypothetical protein HZT43_19535 [Exiguobacterium profundum]|nr:MAG: hypothetical protein HZT43_19535 [Exiguobacterium profundum]
MTVGLAFYAYWGATRDLGPVTERRHNRLTFEDIVIVIISQYGRYFRRETLETIGLKEIAAEIVKPRAEGPPGGGPVRQVSSAWRSAGRAGPC